VKWKFGAHIDVVVGLPTLGLGIAGAVAKELGFGNYFPFLISIKHGELLKSTLC
jgi:adenine/guanine phosphoribosyltransferase-like PRPP-binding protein